MKNYFLVPAIPLLLFAGCSRSSAPTQVQLDSSINGDTLAISPNEKFSLQLDVNADGGYQWNYRMSDSTVITTDAPLTFKPKNSQTVGGVTVETFYFRALKGGQSTMTFTQQRSWEKGVAPISIVKFLVTAKQ